MFFSFLKIMLPIKCQTNCVLILIFFHLRVSFTTVVLSDFNALVFHSAPFAFLFVCWLQVCLTRSHSLLHESNASIMNVIMNFIMSLSIMNVNSIHNDCLPLWILTLHLSGQTKLPFVFFEIPSLHSSLTSRKKQVYPIQK